MAYHWGRLAMALVMSGTAMLAAGQARAAQCGSFSADSGDNVIILGEGTSYFWYQGQKWWYGVGSLYICWQKSNGTHTGVSVSGCDTNSTTADYVYVSALAGDDVVWPNSYTHECVVDTQVWDFDESLFDFYMVADGGSGSDLLLGTDNGDQLRSNVYGTFPNLAPADSADDTLCGYGGNDVLLGDHDDSSTYEEYLWGGAGTGDTCDGGFDGSTYDDLHSTCETRYSGAYTTTDLGGCSGTQDHWWF